MAHIIANKPRPLLLLIIAILGVALSFAVTGKETESQDQGEITKAPPSIPVRSTELDEKVKSIVKLRDQAQDAIEKAKKRMEDRASAHVNLITSVR